LYFRFADFEIDIARHELRQSGTVVHIEPQVFDLIVHLIRNRDRIVGKDELFDVIWEGRIVSEATLSSASARRDARSATAATTKVSFARCSSAGFDSSGMLTKKALRLLPRSSESLRNRLRPPTGRCWWRPWSRQRLPTRL
jgi:hypothetical protein